MSLKPQSLTPFIPKKATKIVSVRASPLFHRVCVCVICAVAVKLISSALLKTCDRMAIKYLSSVCKACVSVCVNFSHQERSNFPLNSPFTISQWASLICFSPSFSLSVSAVL